MLWCSLTIVVVFLRSTIGNEMDRLSYTIVSKTILSTECATDCIHNRCYTDVYNRDMEVCFPGTEAALQYHTVQYKGSSPNCTTRCGRYGYDYDWCYTGKTILDDTWDYCSAKIEYGNKQMRHITKDNIFCVSACDYHDHDYTWCYTVDRSWGMCDKYQYEPYLQSYTYKGEKCLGMCHEQHHYSYNWCYTDRQGNWDYCALPAKTKSSLLNHNGTCIVSTNNSSTRRSNHDDLEYIYCHPSKEYQGGKCFWYQLLQNLHVSNSECPRNYLYKIVNKERLSPIRDYLIYEGDVLGITIPVSVRAIITNKTITSTSCRHSIPHNVSARNMRFLDALPDDDTAHIIASCNGGPSETYNLVPQNRNVNRGGQWRQIEISINNFVRNTDNYVLQNVIIFYDGMDNARWPKGYSLRPIGFYVALSYHYGNDDIANEASCFINNFS